MSALGHAPTGGGGGATPPPDDHRPKRSLTGYLLLIPGGVWLLLFFLIPVCTLIATSLYDPTGSLATGYQMTGHVANFFDAVAEYWPQLLRSLVYGLIATAVCLLLGYPLAYAIAFKAGRWRNLMLVAVIAPFFTSFLVRTLAWTYLLGDHAAVVSFFRTVGLLGPDDHLLATPVAVVTGLIYNFLPFMVLPLYASLEKIDHRLLEAGADLYSSPWAAFRRVTLPLSMPGVVAGTLLTFIPASGDYINAELLGGSGTRMVGNEIQSLFASGNYPIAAALSAILMAVIVIMVLVYVRKAGTEELV